MGSRQGQGKKSGTGPYKTAQLKNGLQVVILEKHHLPVVTTLLCYRVGSRDEGRGETGLSHFLEHMMFKGTSKYGRGEIDLITSRLGGMNNAMTSQDSTCYLFRVAAANWERVLEIEADRMKNCRFVPREFNREKQVVLEELKMGEDQPWQKLFSAVESAAFTVHPYHNPIIGWREDLENVDRQQMFDFYQRHYSPDQAVLVIIGDVREQQAMTAVRRAFGGLKRSGSARPFAPAEPPQEGIRRLTLEAPGETTRLAMAWRGMALSDKREPGLDLLIGMLSSGRNSRLYKRLVKGEEIATSVSAYNESHLDPGLIWVFVELKQGVEPQRVEAIILEEMKKLTRYRVGKRELDKVRARIETGMEFEFEDTYGAAMRVADYVMEADLSTMIAYPDNLAALDATDLQAIAAEFFNPRSLTVGTSLPGGGTGHGGKQVKSTSAGFKPNRYCFRRGDQYFPKVRREVLANGLKVLAQHRPGAPVVTVLCNFLPGQVYEKAENAGIGNLAAYCLAEGTTRRSGDALAEAIESRGGQLGAGGDGVTISMHSRDAERAVELLAETVRYPSFPAEGVARIKAIIINALQTELEHPRSVAALKFREMVYAGSPLGLPARGFPWTVGKLTPRQLKAWHKRLFIPGRAIVTIAGDLDPEEAIAQVARRFGTWRGKLPTTPDVNLPDLPGETQQIHLPMEREQVHLLLGHLGVSRNDPDYYALLVMDHVLGSGAGFTDRISKRLRDQEGLAYHVSASIASSAHLYPGTFSAYIATSVENVAAARKGFLEEIKKIQRQPPSQAEIQAVHDYLTGSYYLALEKCSSAVRFLANLERFDLGLDYLSRYPDLIRAQGRQEILQAAKKHLFPDNMIMVCAGPEGIK